MKRRKFIFNSLGLAAGAYALSSFTPVEGDPKTSSKKILPKGLKKGMTIGITGPAGSIWNDWHITKIQDKMRELGFRTKLGETLYLQDGYLAGPDEVRAAELMDFIANPDIDAILTMRGGWGCARILDRLDYDVIRENPKVIMGFSDITSLINAIYTKTGLVTYHGPCGYSSWNDFSTKEVMKCLGAGKPFYMYNATDDYEQLEVLSPGTAQGEIVGGNLTIMVSMIGTEFEPDWKGKILCLEDVNEEPYRIDRMLWQLKQAGVYDAVNGIVLGGFNKCEPEEPEKSFTIEEIFQQHFKDLNVPVFKGASFGHITNKFTLPIGVMAEMNAEDFSIRTLERSVLA